MATSGGRNEPRVDYPFVCHTTHHGADKSARVMNIRKGEFGNVVKLDRKGWVFVVKSTLNGQESGYVPITSLTFGDVKWGDLTIVSDLVTQPMSHSTRSPFNHPMTGALNNLYGSLRASDEISRLPRWFRDQTKDIPKLLNIMNDGVKLAGPPGIDLLEVFSREFPIQELCNKTYRLVNGTFNERGIYMRVYRLPDGRYYIYIGFSDHLGSWWQSWRDHIGETNSRVPQEHLAIAREAKRAGEIWMFPICLLPRSDARIDAYVERIVEQSFVLLFESYLPSLKEGGRVSIDIDTPQGPGESIANRVGRSFRYAQSARFLMKYQDMAVTNTGWPGGTSRSSLGVAGGLNISSPLGELAYQKQIWVKTLVPGISENYRRNYRTATKRGGSLLLYGKVCSTGMTEPRPGVKNYQATDSAIKLPIVGDGPKLGDQTSTIFEIPLDGKPHPHSYARLPELGMSQDWKDAQSLAVRIEWRDAEGAFKTRYVQATDTALADKEVPGSHRAFADALAMFHYLRQQVVDDRPRWMKNPGVARVSEVHFDPLKQEISVSEKFRDANNVVKLAPLTDQSTLDLAMKAAGAEGVGGIREAIAGNKGPDKRGACDACYLYDLFHPSTRKTVCKTYKNTDRCDFCWGMGRPCTWTPSSALFEGSRAAGGSARGKTLHAAICFHVKSGVAVETIDDPELMTDPGMGAEDDYDD